MSNIVGISCLSHDAAVAVLKDDQIAFAAHSERYSRNKMDKYLCNELIQDAADYIDPPFNAVFYEKQNLKRSRELFAGQYRKLMSTPNFRTYLRQFPLLKQAPISSVGHHYSHACGGYYTSNFHDASIVVIDGIGEWDTLTVWQAKDRQIQRVFSLRYPNSIGLFYSAFTDRCGFKANQEEYIMMGLAALGEPRYTNQMFEDFFVDTHPQRMRFKRNLHRGVRDWQPQLNDIENIAASCQKATEQVLINLFDWVRKELPSKNLVYSGGVALNCVFNDLLAKNNWFDDIWIMPEPGDAGSSLGAALAYRNDWVEWKGPYLGHNIERKLDIEAAVQALVSGKVIGVAHGRAEFGPRALGNRSLLADPRGPNVKNKVNLIKKRELFRPFAPIVLAEYADEYFDLSLQTPYMQFVCQCKKPEEIPAVCHVDGTSRVQTLRETDNPVIYQLLTRFYEMTGCPILLNTSLNIKGEPLVNSVEDANRFSDLNDVKVY